MSHLIQKTFAVAFFENFGARKLGYAAIYQKKQKNGWRYNVTTTADHKPLLDTFPSLQQYRSIQNEEQWVASWDEALLWADDWVWHTGLAIFCREDFAGAVWEAYQVRHSANRENWRKVLHLPPKKTAAG